MKRRKRETRKDGFALLASRNPKKYQKRYFHQRRNVAGKKELSLKVTREQIREFQELENWDYDIEKVCQQIVLGLEEWQKQWGSIIEKVKGFILEAVQQTDFSKNPIVIVGKNQEHFTQLKSAICKIANELSIPYQRFSKPMTVNGVSFIFATMEQVNNFQKYEKDEEVPIEFWDSEEIANLSKEEISQKLTDARNNMIGELQFMRRK